MTPIITVEQLRERIGAPLSDPRVDGRVLDDALEAIIEEQERALRAAALSAARERFLSGGRLLDEEPVFVPLAPLANREPSASARLFVGRVPQGFIPFVFGARLGGRTLDYRTDAAPDADDYFSPATYSVAGSEVTVCDPSVTPTESIKRVLRVWLVSEDAAVAALGSEAVEGAAYRCVKAGRAMLASIRAEHEAQTRGVPE